MVVTKHQQQDTHLPDALTTEKEQNFPWLIAQGKAQKQLIKPRTGDRGRH